MQAVRWVPSSTWVREKPEGISIGIVKDNHRFQQCCAAPKVPLKLSAAGVNSGYPWLILLGAVWRAPSAAVAVDNS